MRSPSFKEARVFARRLGLKSKDEWHDYCKSGKRPPGIPNTPNAVYAKDGWLRWADLLGNGRVAADMGKAIS